MIRYNFKKGITFLLILTSIFVNILVTFAKSNKDENDKIDILYNLNIIDDKENMDDFVNRDYFAKMIVKSSKYKDNSSIGDITSVASDVKSDSENAGYIVKALNNKYMFTYIDGTFKPSEYIKYSDVCRACVTLLSFTSDDFTGNKVNGFNNKFSDLALNDYIEKSYTDYLTKKDVCHAIYNTLKAYVKDSETVYATTIFDTITVDTDKELLYHDNHDDKILGPVTLKSVSELEDLIDENSYSVYLNGIVHSIDDLKFDIDNYKFAVLYYNPTDKMIYSYTERVDVDSPLMLKRGFVNNIEYNAKNMTLPYRVNINDNFYYIDSEEAKFMFSYAGSVSIGDEIYYLANKINDKTKAYIDDDGTVHHDNDDAVIYVGSIVTIFKI